MSQPILLGILHTRVTSTYYCLGTTSMYICVMKNNIDSLMQAVKADQKIKTKAAVMGASYA